MKYLINESINLYKEDEEQICLNAKLWNRFWKCLNMYSSGDCYQTVLEIEFNNTCTIDYFLLAFWCVSKISNVSSQALIDLTQENKIARYFQKIIDLIDIFEWDRARSLWILAVLELKPVNWKFSLF